MSTLGQRLRDARKLRGWTQSDLCEAMSGNRFGRPTSELISRWENDKAYPRRPSIFKLAKALGVEVASLEDGVDSLAGWGRFDE